MHDGNKRGLIFSNCDAVFELVFEKIAEHIALRDDDAAFGRGFRREHGEIRCLPCDTRKRVQVAADDAAGHVTADRRIHGLQFRTGRGGYLYAGGRRANSKGHIHYGRLVGPDRDSGEGGRLKPVL